MKISFYVDKFSVKRMAWLLFFVCLSLYTGCDKKCSSSETKSQDDSSNARTCEKSGTVDDSPNPIVGISGTLAYVADDRSGNVFKCSVNKDSGTLSSCNVSNANVIGWKPFSIQIKDIIGASVAYIADNSGNNTYRCSINAKSRDLEDCYSWSGGNPYTVAVTNINNMYFAYTGGNAGNVNLCQVNSSNGYLSSCVISNGGVGSWYPSGIAFGNLNGNNFAFVANDNGNAAHIGIYTCPLDSYTGAFGSCIKNSLSLIGNGPNDIEIYNISGITYAYLAVPAGAIYKCEISVSGILSNCVVNNANKNWQPTKIDFVALEEKIFAYVGDGFGFYICHVNQIDGSFNSCDVGVIDSKNPLLGYQGISFR